jgi:hypothetical protein
VLGERRRRNRAQRQRVLHQLSQHRRVV